MRWEKRDGARAEMIRVSLGSIFHFGIFVSPEEVWQFGLAPTVRPDLPQEQIEVLSSDLETFLAGGECEVAVFEPEECAAHRTPDEVVAYARSKRGTRGYHILYNNCEHFANECLSGERKCEQADRVRALFRSLPVVDLYLTPVREGESAYEARSKLVAYALERSFGLSARELSFTAEDGCYDCGRAKVAAAEGQGAVAVAVSRARVGLRLCAKEEVHRSSDAAWCAEKEIGGRTFVLFVETETPERIRVFENITL